MIFLKYLALIFLIFATLSFDKSPDKSYLSFKNWYSENYKLFTVESKSNDLDFELTKLPVELLVCQQIIGKERTSKKEIKALYIKHGAYEEYSFKISSIEINNLLIGLSDDKDDYQTKLFYLIESIQHDFCLINNNDTIFPLQSTFENNYGAAPFLKLHLVFPKTEIKKNTRKQIIYSDQLFQSGKIDFDISHLNNLKIPKIK